MLVVDRWGIKIKNQKEKFCFEEFYLIEESCGEVVRKYWKTREGVLRNIGVTTRGLQK